MGKGKAKKDSRFLEQVNRMNITAELLGEVLTMHAAMPPEDRPAFEVRALRIFNLLEAKGFPEEDIATIAAAIEFPLQALARL